MASIGNIDPLKNGTVIQTSSQSLKQKKYKIIFSEQIKSIISRRPKNLKGIRITKDGTLWNLFLFIMFINEII